MGAFFFLPSFKNMLNCDWSEFSGACDHSWASASQDAFLQLPVAASPLHAHQEHAQVWGLPA